MAPRSRCGVNSIACNFDRKDVTQIALITTLDQQLVKAINNFEGAVEAQVPQIAGEKERSALSALIANTACWGVEALRRDDRDVNSPQYFSEFGISRMPAPNLPALAPRWIVEVLEEELGSACGE